MQRILSIRNHDNTFFEETYPNSEVTSKKGFVSQLAKRCLTGFAFAGAFAGTSQVLAANNLLFEGNFETGNFSKWTQKDLRQFKGEKYGDGAVVTSPVRAGKYAFKVDYQRSRTILRKRAEVRPPENTQFEKEYWYGWSTYLPANWKFDRLPELIAQFHGLPDVSLGEPARSPNLGFYLDNNKLILESRWDTKRRSTSKGGEAKRVMYKGAYNDMIGKWTDFVVQAVWTHKSNGYLKIWKNGKLIATANGPTAYNDAKGPYFKIGNYKWPWNNPKTVGDVERRILYHDEIRIAGPGASYSDVAPGGKQTVKTTPKNVPPKVNAGADKTAQLNSPATITLTGSASDDGMPNGQLKMTWNKVSGPGTITFSNASQLTTRATFSKAGKYVLRLSANDGKTSASDTLNVEVRAAPAPTKNTASKPKQKTVRTVSREPKQPVAVKKQARPKNRVKNGIVVYYDFEEGQGSTIKDVSKVGQPLNLRIRNTRATSWVPGGLMIDAPTMLASSRKASKLISAVRATREITVEAWIAPDNKSQKGPARIATLSSNGSNRNITLGQDRTKYQVRLRTTKTGNNGTRPFLATSSNNVFPRLSHIVYTRDKKGRAKLYVNGKRKVSKTIAGKLSNWNGNYRLALANEINGGRAWLGEYQMIAFYKRALSSSEVNQNFKAGPADN